MEQAIGRGAIVGRLEGQGGATSVEYGLIVGAIGIAFIVAGPMLGDAFGALLDVVVNHVLGV